MTHIRDIADINGDLMREAVLRDGDVSMSLLNFGVITRDWQVPCKGASVPVVLGYGDPLDYLKDNNFFGAIVGRVANRTAPASFHLHGVRHDLAANEGKTHLHGGIRGLHKRFWDMEIDAASNAVRFEYTSGDGEEGYPGAVVFSVTVSLSGAVVTYDMQARTSQPTPINMAQHNYYNLTGRGDIWGHRATVFADRYLPLTADLLPTGEIREVAGGRYDFNQTVRFADKDSARAGVDTNLVFQATRDTAKPVAHFAAPNGLSMQVQSNQPGAQLYTGQHLAETAGGHDGQTYHPFSGFCFEPQMFPNALNIDRFPSILIEPDRPYRQKLIIDISETTP